MEIVIEKMLLNPFNMVILSWRSGNSAKWTKELKSQKACKLIWAWHYNSSNLVYKLDFYLFTWVIILLVFLVLSSFEQNKQKLK